MTRGPASTNSEDRWGNSAVGGDGQRNSAIADGAPEPAASADIVTTAGTLERYAVHVADEAEAAGFTAQAFELGVIKALARRIGVLASVGQHEER